MIGRLSYPVPASRKAPWQAVNIEQVIPADRISRATLQRRSPRGGSGTGRGLSELSTGLTPVLSPRILSTEDAEGRRARQIGIERVRQLGHSAARATGPRLD